MLSMLFVFVYKMISMILLLNLLYHPKNFTRLEQNDFNPENEGLHFVYFTSI